ncbi:MULTISPECIES: hypothetical protein [unclassified Cupriavidus]|uniref:hypothetical protein n=1 Tax=unclassified Cupriavidus TaxID=2640874 RepID=UPI00313CBF4F
MTALALILKKSMRKSTQEEIERAARTGGRSDLSFEEAGLAKEAEALRRMTPEQIGRRSRSQK